MRMRASAGTALLLLLTGATLQAAEGPYFSPTTDRVRVSLGVLRSSNKSDARIDSTTGTPGTAFNAEQDLGLDDNKIGPKFQAMIRVGERHRLRFDYFTMDREASKVLEKPITFRNQNFVVGDPVDSQLSLRTLGITYGYSFVRRDRFELSGTFGVNVLDFSARARVQQPNRRIDQRQDQAGPFPTLGIESVVVFSKRWYLDARFQYLKLSISELDGALGFYEFSLMYRHRPNVALGLGYQKVSAKLTSTKATESGFFDFDSKGPELFLRVSF